eukprot:12742-Heterococcus_DN1.PRE.2
MSLAAVAAAAVTCYKRVTQRCPLAMAYCAALQHLDQYSDLHCKLAVPSVALEWARQHADGQALPNDAAFAALTAVPLQLAHPTPTSNAQSGDCTSTSSSVEPSGSNGKVDRVPGLQKRLSRLLLERSTAALWQRLLKKDSRSGKE